MVSKVFSLRRFSLPILVNRIFRFDSQTVLEVSAQTDESLIPSEARLPARHAHRSDP